LNKFTCKFYLFHQKTPRNMKKIALIVSLLLAFTGFSFAQTTPATGTKKAKGPTTATTAATTKPATAATTAKPATTAAMTAKPASTATTAKPATAAAGPTKKDGTPDMRYKANKDAAKTPPVHLKADGTPDKRYKENKPKKNS
jgi:hypothetical protein